MTLTLNIPANVIHALRNGLTIRQTKAGFQVVRYSVEIEPVSKPVSRETAEQILADLEARN